MKQKTGTFKGVVVTAIRLDTLGNLLKNQLFPDSESSMLLMAKNGMILYANNLSFIGKNIFREEFQSRLSTLLSPKLRNSLNELFKTSLQHNTDGSIDIFAQNRMNTIAYEPIIVKENHFMTSFISAPHNFASNVSDAIDQVKNFSILIVIMEIGKIKLLT
jgi:hypothetical protein